MADAAVESLIEYLHQLLIHHSDLISDAKGLLDFDKLEKDLQLFRAYLAGTSEKRRREEGVKRLVRRIRDVVCDLEDMINASMTQAADPDTKYYFLRAFQTPEVLRSICREVDLIRADIGEIYGGTSKFDLSRLSVGEEEPKLSKALPAKQVNVVGFEDEAEKLIGYLSEETPQLDILTVIGVAGLGKTTLAWKVFSDSKIKYEFPTCIWIYVSQQFTKKDIFLSILREFMRLTKDVYGMSDEELAKLVAGHLDTRKFLIVMDDVWKPDDWKELRIAFPMRNKMGKVLITSRFENVANFANPNRDPLMLRFLKPDESWTLFKQEVSSKCECPPALKDVGELIAGQCHGLPLAIMVIAGMLVDKFLASDDMSTRTQAWMEVSEILASYREKQPLELLKKAISLSYDKLPYHLIECFLYLAVFPEDYEIPVRKLIHMWIAEGFIQQKASNSLEAIAENYLEDLTVRNLVRIDKINTRGKAKTCRIHDMIRDLCKSEASERENFLQEMSECGHGVLKPRTPISDVRDFYRVCVHSDRDTLDFLSSKPYGPRVHSFVCFSRDEIKLPPRNISSIPAAFKLLRVLESSPIKFTKVPRSLYQLIHLKYITISFNLSILPAAFAKLWNLHTLTVNTTSYTLEVKVDILKMIQLSHFKTNASATFPNIGSDESEKLQTLGTISPKSCTEELFNGAPNLKKIGIRGQLVLLLGGTNGSFGSLRKLVNLEKLKLLNGELYSFAEGQLPRLPPASAFPPKLRSLTLSNTSLQWSQMPILGSLENLEVLKLKDYAFVGKDWVVADGGFSNLEVLHIGCTNLVNWKASSHHFPSLRCLALHNCEELREVPIGLGDIPSLQTLDLYRTTLAAASAKKVEANIKQAEQSSAPNLFKLCIFPPHE